MQSGFDLFSLSGRVAVVTGAASGLGQAMALGLSGVGAYVVAADLRGPALNEVVERIGPERAVAVEVDITRRDQVEAMAARALDVNGRVDVLINSAGIGGRGTAADYPVDLWEQVIAINLTGTFHCCQIVGRRMLAAGSGSIVNLASIGGLVGWAGSLGYQASKGGVVQLTRTLGVEWAKHGVRVNAIAPCTFETPVVARQREHEPEFYVGFLEQTPIGRFGRPEEIVGPAIFLASDAASMVTGHILTVDGGFTAR